MKSPQRMTLPELMAATEAYQKELAQRLHQGLASLETRTTALRNFAGAFGGEMNGSAPLMLPAPVRANGQAKGRHGAARFKGQRVQKQHTPSAHTESPRFNIVADYDQHRVGKGVVLNGTPGQARYAKPSARFLAGVPGSMYAGQKLTVNPPRYRNPKDANQTWTGHGKRPDWFQRALRGGKHTVQSMTIPGSNAPTFGRRAADAPSVTKLPAKRGRGRPRKDASPAPSGAQGPVFQNPFKPSQRWNGRDERPEWFNIARRHGYTVDELNIGGAMTAEFVKAIKGGGVYKGANALQRAMRDVAETMSHHPNTVARFRNPDDPSETWTGGGSQPKWIADKIAEGHRPEEYLIEGADMPNRKDFAAFQPPAEQQQQPSHN